MRRAVCCHLAGVTRAFASGILLETPHKLRIFIYFVSLLKSRVALFANSKQRKHNWQTTKPQPLGESTSVSPFNIGPLRSSGV